MVHRVLVSNIHLLPRLQHLEYTGSASELLHICRLQSVEQRLQTAEEAQSRADDTSSAREDASSEMTDVRLFQETSD